MKLQGSLLHEQTILHADTFAHRVIFARVTIKHKGSILHEFCFFPRDGSKLRVDIFPREDKIARKNLFAQIKLYNI